MTTRRAPRARAYIDRAHMRLLGQKKNEHPENTPN